MKNVFFWCCILFLFSSCNKEKKEENSDSYYHGQITISTDESFESITKALSDVYSIHYPDAKVNVVAQKENQGFIDLLNKEVDVVVMSRPLTSEEISQYESRIDLPYQPSNFAGEASLFIVPKDSPREFITMEEIEQELSSDKRNIVFDGTNASNLNSVAQVLGKKPQHLKFSIIKGNENLINRIGEFRTKIGVISLNSISRMHSPKAKELRDKIKILPIKVDGKLYDASFQNIKTLKYPFTRILYFLTGEGYFGMANGFIRFSCTSVGQKVVEREGLQKYYDYKREVKISQ